MHPTAGVWTDFVLWNLAPRNLPGLEIQAVRESEVSQGL